MVGLQSNKKYVQSSVARIAAKLLSHEPMLILSAGAK